MELDEQLRQRLITFQRNEITEHLIYTRLASALGPSENRQILERIAADELRHYKTWLNYTHTEIKPDMLHVWMYYVISRLLGLTFGIKLMERGEEAAQVSYKHLGQHIEEVGAIIQDENEHEEALIGLLDEERLRYIGSIVLGLNDALVELTGALAGLTLALQDTRLIALSGTITGLAAALSMGASEYLSTKSEETSKEPLKASIYTGVTYVATVLILIWPYLFLDNFYVCLGWALTAAVLIIALFNTYISVAKDEPFMKRFLEMAGVSLGVAGLSFLIGYVVRIALGVEI
ncbi:MAG: VIT1/CCC1 transporter family protein [Thermoflexales bacterium]|nr:VIT1/CCC1 transporter family protein [Thermoflexales bacterium]